MDSRVVIQSQVNENNDEQHSHKVDSQQVTHGAEEEHHSSDHEKKSVLNKVKAKARKIKDTIKKHGQHVVDHGNGHNNENQHSHDDGDLDEDNEMVEDTEVHEAPIYDSEDVKSATTSTAAFEQVESLGNSGNDFKGTKVMEEEPHYDPLVEGVSSTTEINQNIATDQDKTFAVEEKPGQFEANLERPIILEKYSKEQRNIPSDQTKDTDPSGAGIHEIKDITPLEESLERLNVHDEPKPTTEPKIQPSVADTEYSPAAARSHDQFVPHFSNATKTQTEYPHEPASTDINRKNQKIPSGYEESAVETQSKPKSYTDEIEIDEASKLGNDEKFEQQKSENASSNMSGSITEQGKNIAYSVTEKLAPVYGKVAEVGSAVKSKVYGTETKNEVQEDHEKGFTVKDNFVEKLRPSEEDKALSEVISEALLRNKGKEEPLKKDNGSFEESNVISPGKGVVDKVKDVVGSWFAKSGENQSQQGISEDLPKKKNYVEEVEQVGQVVDEGRKQE